MAQATQGATDVGGLDFETALDGMKQAFEEAITNNLEVNKLSTEGKTAVEAARTKPL